MARVYATLQDYRDWLGDQTATVSPVTLTRASEVIDELLIGAIYTTDSSLMPTDPAVAEAMRDATCVQAYLWNEQGDTLGTGGGVGWKSASIGSASYTKAESAVDPARGGGVDAMVLRPLRAAGLLGGEVILYG